jgi:hypothetical protein
MWRPGFVWGMLLGVSVGFQALSARADPCGMVPPVYIEGPTPITRIGLQSTYVFYKDGIETFIIRPGFQGRVEEFGMLIPFPTPPAIRKVPEEIFGHLDAAIDPPEVVIDLRQFLRLQANAAAPPAAQQKGRQEGLGINDVRLLRQEAVGMYEVAVLEAGSAAALKRWMDDHGYVYPNGMDKVCDEYVDLRWCFVAVKTRVGPKQSVDPQPGMRQVDPRLPKGSTFDGHVQAMGFRFPVKELVVPMRLSAFNEGEMRNVVYLLTDGPRRIRSIPEEYVVRQISGQELFRNVTQPLPLRIVGGTVSDLQPWQTQNLAQQRDPVPHNGHARDVFAADLLAVKSNRLSHPHEEAEKMLLRIGEHLSLRGPDIDALNLAALADARQQAVTDALEDLKQMTMTVIDGDFPREVLGAQNLQFAEYRMPAVRNSPRLYNVREHGPAAAPEGVLYRGNVDVPQLPPGKLRGPQGGASWLPGGRSLAYAGFGVALCASAFFWGWSRHRHTPSRRA